MTAAPVLAVLPLPRSAAEREPIAEVADALWVRASSLAQQQLTLAPTMRSYDYVPDEDLLRSARRNTLRVVAMLRGSVPTHLDVQEDERESSRQRALQGIAVDDLVFCYRLAMGALRDAFIEEAAAHRLPADMTLAVIRELWTVTDRYSTELITARTSVDAGIAMRQDRSRQVFLQRLLLGGLRSSELAISGARYGLSPEAEYWVVRARQCDKRTAEIIAHLERYAVGAPTAPLVGTSGRDVAALVRRRPAAFDEDMPMAVVGPVRVTGVQQAFGEAARLLCVARRYRRGGIVETGTLGLLVAVANEPEIGEALYGKYVAPIWAHGRSMAEVLLHTVSAFLDHNRAYQSTADSLNIHVNTLRHRLSRYEELIGETFGRPETAFEVWWAFRYARLRRETPKPA